MPVDYAATLAAAANLQPNWDSYNGIPPTAAAIAGAMNLCDRIDSIAPLALRSMSIVAGPNGDIGLEWHIYRMDVELCVMPDGRLRAGYHHDVVDGIYHEIEWWVAHAAPRGTEDQYESLVDDTVLRIHARAETGMAPDGSTG